MERVGTLVNKLQEQWQQGADTASMLVNARLLISELQSAQQQPQQPATNGKPRVSVFIPAFTGTGENDHVIAETPAPSPMTIPPAPVAVEEEVVEAEKEPELEPELDLSPTAMVEEEQAEPEMANAWLFDLPTDIPTLSHQPATRMAEKEVYELNELLVAQHDHKELNERLRDDRVEVATMLQGSPVRDLRKAIGINDRYLFVNELFRGDESMYERSLKTINGFTIYPEAQYWIERELKVKMGWKDDCETARLFDQIVRRRFS